MVSTPSRRAASSASNGSRHRSNARCRVTPQPPARAISSAMRGSSSAPSGVSTPMTTPSAPSAAKRRTCRRSSSNSESEYKKSPKRGRSSTRIGMSTRSRTMRNRSSQGEVPPMTRFSHSSSRVAPPRAALTADSTESTQTSSILAILRLPFSFLSCFSPTYSISIACAACPVNAAESTIYGRKRFHPPSVTSCFWYQSRAFSKSESV